MSSSGELSESSRTPDDHAVPAEGSAAATKSSSASANARATIDSHSGSGVDAKDVHLDIDGFELTSAVSDTKAAAKGSDEPEQEMDADTSPGGSGGKTNDQDHAKPGSRSRRNNEKLKKAVSAGVNSSPSNGMRGKALHRQDTDVAERKRDVSHLRDYDRHADAVGQADRQFHDGNQVVTGGNFYNSATM